MACAGWAALVQASQLDRVGARRVTDLFTEARRADRELLGKKAAVGAMFGWRDYL